jgi:hypothetical protein
MAAKTSSILAFWQLQSPTHLLRPPIDAGHDIRRNEARRQLATQIRQTPNALGRRRQRRHLLTWASFLMT